MGARRYIVALKNIVVGQLNASLRPGNVAAFHLGRSGSTVLGDLLNQHPHIFWDGEIYNSDMLKALPAKASYYVTRYPISFLRLKMARAGKSFYGFETLVFDQLKFINIELSDYIEQLQALGFSQFILLKRKNYLRQIISNVIAHKKSRWHKTHYDKFALSQIKLDLDQVQIGPSVKPLVYYLHYNHRLYRMLEKNLQDKKLLRLTYEDDIAPDPLIAYGRVCDFLGLERHPVSVRYGKTNPYKLTELIGNFGEVERALLGTPFEWMLYE